MSAEPPLTALERSVFYRGLAEAFRSPSGGVNVLDESWIPAPSPNAKTEFLEAFEPSVSKAACSLYESAHSNRDQTALFEELIRWYDHFGLQRKAKAELPDHISVELEFMHFLCYREHLSEGDEAAIGPLRRAQKEFLNNHLHPLSISILGYSQPFANRFKVLCGNCEQFLREHTLVLENG
ncbi:MAG: molecular chaperone TorD family protein [Pseudomonadota bacterium]